jgi:hypothetical protein
MPAELYRNGFIYITYERPTWGASNPFTHRSDYITNGWSKPVFFEEIWVRPTSRSTTTTNSQSVSCMRRFH